MISDTAFALNIQKDSPAQVCISTSNTVDIVVFGGVVVVVVVVH